MIRGVIRLISGRHAPTRQRLVQLLDSQLASTLEALNVVSGTLVGDLDWAISRESIASIEHRGDAARSQLVVELSHSLVTPIDREDIFRLSRSIDDILDNLRDFIREGELYGVDDLAPFPALVEAIHDAVVRLRVAVNVINSDPSQIGPLALSAKKAGGQIRRRYQLALATLFAADPSSDVLKARELLRRLDIVGLRLNEAADALADAAVKRSEA